MTDSTSTASTAPTGTDDDGAPLNTVTWWELPVTEVERAKAFYGSVFGWTFTSFGDDESYAGVMNGSELVGGLYKAEESVGTGPVIRTYVNVADLEATIAAAEAAGGSVRTPRTEVGGDMGWWAEITDPDGRWVGLCTGRPAS